MTFRSAPVPARQATSPNGGTDVRVVLLDADGVFQRTPPGVWQEIHALTPRPDKVAFRSAILAAEHECVADGVDLDARLPRVLSEWNCTVSATAFLELWYTIELDPGILEVVATLRSRGIVCCIASNQLRGRAMRMSETLGLRNHFDREFYAYALGALKPHPDFYSGILCHLGIEASRVLFVDDRSENVAAANAAGMRAHHFPEFGGAEALRSILSTQNLLHDWG